MPVNITQVDRNVLKAEYNGFEIIAGRPSENEEYVGMPWGVVMIAGLGLCTVSRALDQAMLKGYEAEGVTAAVNTTLDESGRYAKAFDINIELKAEIPEDKLKELLYEAEHCFVQNTIREQPEIKVNIKLV
ncbi:OsmC family protein [Candidatus Bathyarchaeota archaeon]|nr:OsmC family protein [Candidatus Bathyarchaeota archaeon]